MCVNYTTTECLERNAEHSKPFTMKFKDLKLLLLTVKQQRNILNEISKRKANCVGHIFRRNCLLRRVIEKKIKGWIEVTGRRGRRRRKLLHDLKERRGGNTSSNYVVSSLWTRLRTCLKTDY